jgi:YHS domain-containing protein
MNSTIRAALAAAFTLGASIGAASAGDDIFTSRFSNAAAGGYDVVAYFEDGAAVKGDKAFSLSHKGAEWRFASKAHLDAFAASPERYEPQYGGYCAWAAAQGYKAPGNPQYWTVRNDKLYLNYDAKVQERWLVDPDGFIAKADANWPGIASE